MLTAANNFTVAVACSLAAEAKECPYLCELISEEANCCNFVNSFLRSEKVAVLVAGLDAKMATFPRGQDAQGSQALIAFRFVLLSWLPVL